jgi:hypothetical protein
MAGLVPAIRAHGAEKRETEAPAQSPVERPLAGLGVSGRHAVRSPSRNSVKRSLHTPRSET